MAQPLDSVNTPDEATPLTKDNPPPHTVLKLTQIAQRVIFAIGLTTFVVGGLLLTFRSSLSVDVRDPTTYITVAGVCIGFVGSAANYLYYANKIKLMHPEISFNIMCGPLPPR